MNYVQMDFIIGILTITERTLKQVVGIAITRCNHQTKTVVTMLITHAFTRLDHPFESCTDRLPVLRREYRNQQSPAYLIKRTFRIEMPAAISNDDIVENLIGTGAAKMLLYKFPDDAISRAVVTHRQ